MSTTRSMWKRKQMKAQFDWLLEAGLSVADVKTYEERLEQEGITTMESFVGLPFEYLTKELNIKAGHVGRVHTSYNSLKQDKANASDSIANDSSEVSTESEKKKKKRKVSTKPKTTQSKDPTKQPIPVRPGASAEEERIIQLGEKSRQKYLELEKEGAFRNVKKGTWIVVEDSYGIVAMNKDRRVVSQTVSKLHREGKIGPGTYYVRYQMPNLVAVKSQQVFAKAANTKKALGKELLMPKPETVSLSG